MIIQNTAISMIRGDSESITVQCFDSDGNIIPLDSGDKIYFTVKQNVTSDTKAFQKIITTFTEGKALIDILPSDTKALKFGQYKYDVQLTRADNSVVTIIPPSQFNLLEEVTWD